MADHVRRDDSMDVTRRELLETGAYAGAALAAAGIAGASRAQEAAQDFDIDAAFATFMRDTRPEPGRRRRRRDVHRQRPDPAQPLPHRRLDGAAGDGGGGGRGGDLARAHRRGPGRGDRPARGGLQRQPAADPGHAASAGDRRRGAGRPGGARLHLHADDQRQSLPGAGRARESVLLRAVPHQGRPLHEHHRAPTRTSTTAR